MSHPNGAGAEDHAIEPDRLEPTGVGGIGGAERFPLRYWAMADAARCYSEAGETGRARDLALRLYAERPSDLSLPEYQLAMLRELRQTRTP